MEIFHSPYAAENRAFGRDSGGGSHFAFSEGWLPLVSAGQRIYSPYQRHLLPTAGYQGGSHFLATSWLPPENPELQDVAARGGTRRTTRHETDENNC